MIGVGDDFIELKGVITTGGVCGEKDICHCRA